MKNMTLLLAFILSMNFFSAKAEEKHRSSVVFVEQGIEFIVYTNGDFSYTPVANYRGGTSTSVNIATRNGSTINIATNNRAYQPQVFAEYDRYGRIARVNDVLITYHHNNKVAQIGSAYIDYNGRNVYLNNGGYYASGYRPEPLPMPRPQAIPPRVVYGNGPRR